MTLCPQCGKHLLSQASARCNWCGVAINDAEYQARAQAEREAYYRHTAAHDAQSLAATEALLLLGTPLAPFTNAPMFGPRRVSLAAEARAAQSAQEAAPVPHSPSENEPIKNEAEEAGERFRHLEI